MLPEHLFFLDQHLFILDQELIRLANANIVGSGHTRASAIFAIYTTVESTHITWNATMATMRLHDHRVVAYMRANNVDVGQMNEALAEAFYTFDSIISRSALSLDSSMFSLDLDFISEVATQHEALVCGAKVHDVGTTVVYYYMRMLAGY